MAKKVFISDEEIRKVGMEIASLWGGTYLSYEAKEEEKKIILNCIEFDEYFITEITYNELWEKVKELRKAKANS